MLAASRSFELERPIADVWRVYSDFGAWAEWFGVSLLLVSQNYRFAWAGAAAGAGAKIAVEINGRRADDWVAREWSPPNKLFVSSGREDQYDFFELAVSLTPLTTVSTQVDVRTRAGVPSFGWLDSLIPVRLLFERKLDGIVADANKRVLMS